MPSASGQLGVKEGEALTLIRCGVPANARECLQAVLLLVRKGYSDQ